MAKLIKGQEQIETKLVPRNKLIKPVFGYPFFLGELACESSRSSPAARSEEERLLSQATGEPKEGGTCPFFLGEGADLQKVISLVNAATFPPYDHPSSATSLSLTCLSTDVFSTNFANAEREKSHHPLAPAVNKFPAYFFFYTRAQRFLKQNKGLLADLCHEN